VSTIADEAARPRRTLCLGEALVDLICERPIEDLARADSFVPHFGGAVANVAVIAARYGAHVTLAGGAGDDAWGAWLRARLRREGVDVSLFKLIAGSQTPLAMVAVGADGEPSYEIYGGALLVRANEEEVALMTGEGDSERAALALLESGARLVVVTLGAEGAILRGEVRADVPGVPADVFSTIGAGDVLSGILLAGLADRGFEPAAVAAALPLAVEASARACERWAPLE